MTFPSAIVAIVAILAWAYLRSTRRQEQGQEQGRHPPASLPASPALEREVMDLRKRIEVLERIITDNRETHRLAQDIEALRE